MKYIAEFKNINEILYQVEFDVNNGVTGQKELLLSSEPFITELNSDELYAPLKLTNATCTILTDTIITDLFANKVHDVKVILKNINTNKIEFVGYTTANAYNQQYVNEFESLSIELIDAVSSLEYIEYQQVNELKTTYLSFLTFIIDAIKRTNSISKIYINNNAKLIDTQYYNNIIEKLYVHEKNFINNDGNTNYKEVLKKLMSYINCTLIQHGDEVYIIDYEYLKINGNNYTIYSTSDNWVNTTINTIQLSHNHTVTPFNFMDNATNLSLTETYNKASIEIENNVVTDLIPEIYDDELLRNITFENGVDNSYYTYTDNGNNTKHIIRFVRNEKINDIHYSYSTANNGTYTQITQPAFYDSVKLKSSTYFGGTLRQIANYKTDEPTPSTLNFENYIALKRWYSNQITTQNQPKLKMFEYVGTEDVALLYNDYYFMINFDVNFDDNFNSYYPYENETPANANQIEALANGLKIPCKLQIGNKYWNGTNWTTTDSFFDVNINLNGSKKLFYKWYSVNNQTVYTDEIDGDGQKIIINKSDGLVGNPIFSIWTPTFTAQTYSIFYGTIWLKNFNLQLTKKDNLLGVRKENTDTVYENIINDDFVNKFSPMTAELNTDVNKGLCFTSVLYKDDNQLFKLLEDVQTDTNTTKKFELNKIENIVNQHNIPKNKIELSLNNIFKCYSIVNFMNKNYVIDSYSIDYKLDKVNITMISY